MGAPDAGGHPRASRRRVSLAAAGALALAGFGCAHAPVQPAADPAAQATPVPPPQTVTPAAPSPPRADETELVPARVRDNQPVVIEEGGDSSSSQQGLAAAADTERRRRDRGATPAIVINDQNLAQHATGKLTVTNAPPPGSTNGAANTGADAAKPGVPVRDEQYWRERVRSLRQQWALSVEAIGELQERANGLRTRFYAEADPYVRDGQIKPTWDKTLENLQAAKERARSFEEQLATTLEEGRQGGALPGWLRDGVDLEPKDRPYEEPAKRPPHDDGDLIKEPEELGKPPGG